MALTLPAANLEMLPDNEAIKQIPISKEKILFIDDEELLAEVGKKIDIELVDIPFDWTQFVNEKEPQPIDAWGYMSL